EDQLPQATAEDLQHQREPRRNEHRQDDLTREQSASHEDTEAPPFVPAVEREAGERQRYHEPERLGLGLLPDGEEGQRHGKARAQPGRERVTELMKGHGDEAAEELAQRRRAEPEGEEERQRNPDTVGDTPVEGDAIEGLALL